MEKEMATHSSILAWKIPWTEESCRIQSMELQRVGHIWVSEHENKQISPTILSWIKSPQYVIMMWRYCRVIQIISPYFHLIHFKLGELPLSYSLIPSSMHCLLLFLVPGFFLSFSSYYSQQNDSQTFRNR